MKFELGKVYEVEYADHYTTEDKGSQEAVFNEDTVLKTYGVFVGKNKKYIILSWNYCELNKSDSDNMHILKNCIIKSKELK